MEPGDFPDDGQSKATSLGIAGIQAMEGRSQMLKLLCGNTRTIVFHE